MAKAKKKGGSITDFSKRVKSILWRQDGQDKKTYNKWKEAAQEFEDGGMNRFQATVQAAKDFSCLERLFREYDVSCHDPHPDSHPRIHKWGDPAPIDDIENKKKEQSYRENLQWAIDAAGKYLRTGEHIKLCPNDAAYYLYRQACDEPKDFLGKFGQVESRGNDDLEEQRLARKSGRRSIEEINEMLSTLVSEGEE